MVETACAFLTKGSLNTLLSISEEMGKAGCCSSPDCLLQLFVVIWTWCLQTFSTFTEQTRYSNFTENCRCREPIFPSVTAQFAKFSAWTTIESVLWSECFVQCVRNAGNCSLRHVTFIVRFLPACLGSHGAESVQELPGALKHRLLLFIALLDKNHRKIHPGIN